MFLILIRHAGFCDVFSLDNKKSSASQTTSRKPRWRITTCIFTFFIVSFDLWMYRIIWSEFGIGLAIDQRKVKIQWKRSEYYFLVNLLSNLCKYSFSISFFFSKIYFKLFFDSISCFTSLSVLFNVMHLLSSHSWLCLFFQVEKQHCFDVFHREERSIEKLSFDDLQL